MKNILKDWEFDYLNHLYEIFSFRAKLNMTYSDFLKQIERSGGEDRLTFHQWLKNYLQELEEEEEYEECRKLSDLLEKLSPLCNPFFSMP